MIRLMTAICLLVSGSAMAEGLKKVNYENATSDSKQSKPPEGSPALSPEASQKLNKDLESIKKNQEASRKALEELDAEE